MSRVLFIRRAKGLGFTLKEISELLELRVDPKKSCADVRALARAKMGDVEGKIAALTKIKAGLERLARAWPRIGPDERVPDPRGDRQGGRPCPSLTSCMTKRART